MSKKQLEDAMVESLASLPALAQEMSTLTGFDREDMDTGGKSLGILQYCHLASSGEVHQIGSDETGAYTKLTGQTHFADGTALADRTLMQYHDTGEDDFRYWRHGILNTVTDAKFIQVNADFKGYIGYNASGELDDSITDVRELIVRTPLVAFLYLNGTSGEVTWYADERHGIVLDGQAHLRMHQNDGYFVGGGLDIHGIINNGTVWVKIDSGGCGDEDIKTFYPEITSAKKIWMEGINREWRIGDDDNKFAIFRGGDACYNSIVGVPILAPIGSDRVVMHFVTTNNKLAPVVVLVGQKLHGTRTHARAFGASDYDRVISEGLPSQEGTAIGSVIVNSESSGTAEVGAEGEIWYDHRTADSTMREAGDND